MGEPEVKPPLLTCEVPFKVRLPMLLIPAAYWKRPPTVRATFMLMPPAPCTVTFGGPLDVGQYASLFTPYEPLELLKTSVELPP